MVGFLVDLYSKASCGFLWCFEGVFSPALAATIHSLVLFSIGPVLWLISA
jgi:hypothetical protein